MSNFKNLGLIEPILKAINEQKFKEPTDIQKKAIPIILEGKDVTGGSATGSGKTLAFGAGIIQNIERGKGIQSLVLTPTRELAEQVSNELKKFSKHKPLNIVSVYGGVSINPQIEKLPSADIVVATPGRVLDHLERRTIDLSKVKILVLDEADKMLDMGFLPDVKRIIKMCPKERQTLFFSATISNDTEYITKRLMNNPVEISVDEYVDPKKLRQVYYDVDDKLKFSLLVHLLKSEKSGLVMVFCNSRQNTDFVAKNLKLNDIDAIAIHGGFSQDKRGKTLNRFNSEKVCVLVCTDVASRGLDIKGVSHVYNYDIPKDSKQYVHRIGRTARAGKEGIAINILSPRDHDNFSRILRFNDVDVEKKERPYIERAKIKIIENKREGRPNFRRGNNRRGNNSRRSNSDHKDNNHRGGKNGRHRKMVQ
ncbi:MAG: DEAD/DEAH box helicase [Candidatus Woesearchaeota archaeon]